MGIFIVAPLEGEGGGWCRKQIGVGLKTIHACAPHFKWLAAAQGVQGVRLSFKLISSDF